MTFNFVLPLVTKVDKVFLWDWPDNMVYAFQWEVLILWYIVCHIESQRFPLIWGVNIITFQKALFPYQHVIGIINKIQQPIWSSYDYLWHHYSIYKDCLIPLARRFFRLQQQYCSRCGSRFNRLSADCYNYEWREYRRQCNCQSHCGNCKNWCD